MKGFANRRTSAIICAVDIRFPSANAYAVSQYEQRKSHPVSRMKMHGNPANVLSPCRLRQISLTTSVSDIAPKIRAAPLGGKGASVTELNNKDAKARRRLEDLRPYAAARYEIGRGVQQPTGRRQGPRDSDG